MGTIALSPGSTIRSLAAALALVGLLTVGVTAAPAAPSAQTPQLTPTKAVAFPDRNYVLTLPRRTVLDPAAVTVVENGQPVNDLRVDPPGGQSVTMLLIDASLTMRGKPIADAMAAARAFAGQRNADQKLAVATFNKKVALLLPFTNDQAKITQALSRQPKTAYGTVVYDAVSFAVDEIRKSGATAGTIVLLADGQNVGSQTTLPAAITKLRAADVRLFSVGLRSRAFYAPPLRRLASTTHGTYAETASSTGLGSIYNALGQRLANEYYITYRSLAGPSQQVFVSVKVPGISAPAVSSYRSPGLPVGAVSVKSWWDRFIQSTIAASLVVVLVVALLGLAVFLLVRRRDRRFERRLSRFVQLPPDEQARLRKADVAESLDEPEQRPRFTVAGWYRNFEEEVELSRIDMNPTAIVILTVAGALIAGGVFAAVVSSGWGLLVGLLVPLGVRWFVGWRLRKVRLEFAEQLPDNLDVVSSALRAGHSLVGALSVTVEASSEPSRSELGRALADEQLGVPLDDALRVVAKRMDNRDLIQVAMVSMLQREAGTNAAEVLERVAENVRNQMDLKRLVRTLTAQGRLARWIVSFLPVFLFLAMFTINRTYLAPLWETTGGIVAMCVAAVMVVSGSFIIKRIVEIEV